MAIKKLNESDLENQTIIENTNDAKNSKKDFDEKDENITIKGTFFYYLRWELYCYSYPFSNLVDLESEGYLYSACSNPTYVVLVIALSSFFRSTLPSHDDYGKTWAISRNVFLHLTAD